MIKIVLVISFLIVGTFSLLLADNKSKQTNLIIKSKTKVSSIFLMQEPQTDLERINLVIGKHNINVQHATAANQVQLGLMYHKNLAENDGMLFSFNSAQNLCFWMENTYIALTAAFIDENGIIINFADMKPLDKTNHCAIKPAKYVLEMNKDWFTRNQIKIGDEVKGLN